MCANFPLRKSEYPFCLMICLGSMMPLCRRWISYLDLQVNSDDVGPPMKCLIIFLPPLFIIFIILRSTIRFLSIPITWVSEWLARKRWNKFETSLIFARELTRKFYFIFDFFAHVTDSIDHRFDKLLLYNEGCWAMISCINGHKADEREIPISLWYKACKIEEAKSMKYVSWYLCRTTTTISLSYARLVSKGFAFNLHVLKTISHHLFSRQACIIRCPLWLLLLFRAWEKLNPQIVHTHVNGILFARMSIHLSSEMLSK